MTKLLVSVRDSTEARIALEAGVDLIDIKEPGRGSLGKADGEIIDDIINTIQLRCPLSVALGELLDYDDEKLARLSLSPAIGFAKIGLAHCRRQAAWQQRWAAAWEHLPPTVGRVAVIYADWQAAGAPPPPDVLHHAVRLKCRAILIDTYDKSLPGLYELWTAAEIGEITAAARQHGMLSVLAGRITADRAAELLHHHPDYLAVRGAVCHPDRRGKIEGAKIGSFRKILVASLELVDGALREKFP
ncbi:MAG: hypothetical protein IT427_15210 [Pirellulales bacterium]|nr:hypothetical protein [Pirellulales bacterium]